MLLLEMDMSANEVDTMHEVKIVDHEEMANSVFENVLNHLLDRAVKGMESRQVETTDQRETAGYFVVNISDKDHTHAFNHFRSLFGIKVDQDEQPIRPLHNRVLASFGNFALIQEVSTHPDEVSGDEVAYGVSVSVVSLCESNGGPLQVKSLSTETMNTSSDL